MIGLLPRSSCTQCWIAPTKSSLTPVAISLRTTESEWLLGLELRPGTEMHAVPGTLGGPERAGVMP